MRGTFLNVILSAFIFSACGNNNNGNTQPDSGQTVDTAIADTSEIECDATTCNAQVDGPPPSCGVEIYPCAPYGTNEGEAVENFTFQGFADEDYLCKAPEDMERDLTTLRDISFKNIYQGDPVCGKKQLLWVMVSAGWCSACATEAEWTQEQYEKGNIDPRVILVNVLIEDDKKQPITAEFAKLWAYNNQFQLTFPILLDPQFIMGKYFNKNALPFNMLVDLEDMTIFYRTTGANIVEVGRQMQNFFDSKN